jgi:hypothetical protein
MSASKGFIRRSSCTIKWLGASAAEACRTNGGRADNAPMPARSLAVIAISAALEAMDAQHGV